MKKSLECVLADLKQDYLHSLTGKIERINEHLATDNRKGLRDEFHKLKGTGLTYGFPHITVLAKIIEERCEKTSHDELSWLIPAAVRVLSKIQLHSLAQSDSQVDDDVDFIRIRTLNT